ncbi:DUF397 domain-containing protein [Streptomyces capitiformicae]|uniref:DUF397 domain-containing protein n=1 Tax=Streptomyces capitiformicae TaxID=2014920 RepID=A0A919GLL1_9ACTN|nr:DUF397 domain-containing protein [Streptomyces capitiformicae]GHH87080.1 hypothetical protein GCM10017771_26810 [Streptomyces capitiformicae]
MNETQITDRLAATDWFKSSYSAADNECVEVSHAAQRVGIRDSKAIDRRGFTVGSDAFAAFVASLKNRSSGRMA